MHHRNLLLAGLLGFITLLGAALPPSTLAAPNATFTVNSDLDLPDKKPGNGICETARNNHVCTLRAAIMETNKLGGKNVIILPEGTYYLSRAGANEDNARIGDLDIKNNLTIKGAGLNATIIDGSRAQTGDRVFHILSGPVKIQGVTIQNGGDDAAKTQLTGGGIYVNAGAKLTLVKILVESNRAAAGGGIYSLGNLVIKKSTIDANSALSTTLQDLYGGGIFNGSTATTSLTKTSVTNNLAGFRGGGIHNVGKLTLKQSTLQYNTADNQLGYYSYGGGIHSSGGKVTITDSTIEYNAAKDFGGGIVNFATMTLTSSTVSTNGAYYGGGLYSGYETTSIVNSTFVYNTAYADGGAIFNDDDGIVQLLNATIALNSNNNGVGYSGGLYRATGTVYLRNSLVAANNPHDCYGAFSSQDFNLIQSAPACNFSGATSNNIVGADALLTGYSNWGGPTWTVGLNANSPAIDKGKPSGCTDQNGAVLTRDQRGESRPVDGDGTGGPRCDIGAFEYHP